MKLILGTVILVAGLLTPFTSAAADERTELFGTVLTGSGALGRQADCEAAPDCLAWLLSGCDPALMGSEPALMTSIRGVEHLAERYEAAEFQYLSAVPDGLSWLVPQWAGAVVQFWDEDCAEIPGTEWSSDHCFPDGGWDCAWPTITIPVSARWMTVGGAYAGNPPTVWTLTPVRARQTAPEREPTVSEPPRPQTSPTTEPDAEPTSVARSVDLALRGHLRSVGEIASEDAACRSGVGVLIQRKRSRGWFDVASTTSDADGAFAVRLIDRSGSYRAVTREIRSADRTCLEAVSATHRHRH